MVDPVLVIGAVVAALGIATFGFLYLASNDDDGYDSIAKERREKLLIPEPKIKKVKVKIYKKKISYKNRET